LEPEEEILATPQERERAVQGVMSEQFFEDLFKYGIYRLKSKFNITYDLHRGFRGIMLEDLRSEVLSAFIRPNGRNWNKSNFPEFKDQVLSAYDSHICNTIEKEFDKASQTDRIPDENFDQKDSSNAYEELLNSIIEILGELGCSDEEILLFEPYYVNKMKRSDIATAFKMSVSEVTNIGKQLDRKIPVLRYELTKIYEGRTF